MEDRAPEEAEADLRPWRKRHPVLSRVMLYAAGAGLAVLLVLLLSQRREEDRAAHLRSLAGEMDGLSLVLAADPTGSRVRAILDADFGDPALPVRLRERALRWRALAWRRQIHETRGAASAAGHDRAVARCEAALKACAALDLEPAERVALGLEWAESRLERRDVAGALKVLPSSEDAREPAQALLRVLLGAQARRLDGREAEAARAVRDALQQTPDARQTSYVGGRSWTALQVAVELADFLTLVAHDAGDAPVWMRLREHAPASFPVQMSAARGLSALGRPTEALEAWRAACALDARQAAAAAREDPALAALDRRRHPG